MDRPWAPRCLKPACALALGFLMMCWPASAAASGNVSATPSQIEFGAVADGSSATQTVTLMNTGSQQQVLQLLFLVAGTPSAWAVQNDGCSGQTLNPGGSCQITLAFQPNEVGYRDGALVLANTGNAAALDTLQNAPANTVLAPQTQDKGGNPTNPVNLRTGVGGASVVVVGFSGTGAPSPGGALTITGNRAAGSTLTCDPSGDPPGDSYSYQWLRDGHLLGGANASTLALTDANVGQSFACQALDTNAVGSIGLSSAPTPPIAPMALMLQPGAFTDEGTCRVVQTSHLLRVRGDRVGISAPAPVTPWAPLALTSRAQLRVAIDGRVVASGKHIAITPQTLSNFADGLNSLQVSSRGQRAGVEALLAPCSLAVRLEGGPAQSTILSGSSLYGMSRLTFRLPAGLRIDVLPHQKLGWATYKPAGYPARVFDIVGARTTWNNVTLTVTGHTVTLANLPIQTGVVTLRFAAGVVTGHPGTVELTALERGQRRATRAFTPSTWLP